MNSDVRHEHECPEEPLPVSPGEQDQPRAGTRQMKSQPETRCVVQPRGPPTCWHGRQVRCPVGHTFCPQRGGQETFRHRPWPLPQSCFPSPSPAGMSGCLSPRPKPQEEEGRVRSERAPAPGCAPLLAEQVSDPLRAPRSPAPKTCERGDPPSARSSLNL